MAFRDIWNELRGYLPTLSPFLAQKLVNRAWQDILDSDDWSFLQGMTVIQIPAMVNQGLITFTQFQNTINCDATASSVLLPLVIPPAAGVLPLVAQQNAAGQPLIGTGYQIRFLDGPLYSIVGLDASVPSALVLTVDRIISEPSRSGINYQSYRQYIGVPSSDFLNWTSITNTMQGYTIRGPMLLGSQAQLNAVDPQRTSTEDFYFLFSLFADANGMPIKEAWPGPVNQTGYIGMYKRRGQPLSDTNDLPISMPVNCVLERAKMYAAQWKTTQPRQANDTTDWRVAWQVHQANYERAVFGELAAAKKKDTSLRTPPPIIRRGPFYNFPFSSQFCANHDVNRMMCAFPGLWCGY